MKTHLHILIISIVLLFNSCAYSQKSCIHSNQNTLSEAEENFEYLWHLFDEKYPTFEEKQLDWNVSYNTYRYKVTSSTTDIELYRILCSMIAPLNDAHIRLTAKSIDSTFSARRPSRLAIELKGIKGKRKAIRDMTDNTISTLNFHPLKHIGPKFKGNPLFSFTNNSKIGYLRFQRCFSTMFFGEYPVNGLFLNKQLDEVFKSFKDMEAIIIDVRTNMGGDDTFANKVVGRLTNVKLLGHYKQEKKGKDVFGKLIPKYINPAGKFRFLKKVYLITDDKTVSAADVLALDMKQIPNVTIVGDNTNGSFSDIYSDRLPNGWVIDISNERYLSPTMINYEGKGVPVDIKAYTTFEDVKNKNDSVLLKVIRIIETIPE
ncbi:MAG: hypothetical protein ACJA2M_000850 [Polaribacter sp.]|jgi:hypothetical protein